MPLPAIRALGPEPIQLPDVRRLDRMPSLPAWVASRVASMKDEYQRSRAEITVRAAEASRFMILGGEPMDGPRHIWWNFVSSRLARIEQAKADWKAARFDSVPGETEFIPLPEPPPRRCAIHSGAYHRR